MAIDAELLERAKSGSGDDAFQAARKILTAAWDVAYCSGYTAKSSYLRELMPFIADVLVEIVPKEGIKYIDLADKVLERDDFEAMLELFDHAWDGAPDLKYKEGWSPLRSIVTVLFLVANHECQ